MFCTLLQKHGSYKPLDSSFPVNLDVKEDPICSDSGFRLDIDSLSLSLSLSLSHVISDIYMLDNIIVLVLFVS